MKQSLEDYIEGRLQIGSCCLWAIGIFVAIVLCFTDPMFAFIGISILVILILSIIIPFVTNAKRDGPSSPKKEFKKAYFYQEEAKVNRERKNETVTSVICPGGHVSNFTRDDLNYTSLVRCKRCNGHLFIDNYRELKEEFDAETRRRVAARWNTEGTRLWEEVEKLQQEKMGEIAIKYKCQNCGKTSAYTWDDIHKIKTSNLEKCTACNEGTLINKEGMLRRFYSELISEARSNRTENKDQNQG